MSDTIDQIDKVAFAKAMARAAVIPGRTPTPEQWKSVWAAYGRERTGTFKSYLATLGDVLRGLRAALAGHKEHVAQAKASLVELDTLRDAASVAGANDLILEIARQRGTLTHLAEYAAYDIEATRRAAQNLGLDLKEGMDR